MVGEEKRNYARLGLAGKVILKAENGRSRTFKVPLNNISLGGFAFAMYTRQGLEAERNVEFALMTPLLDRPLMGKGKIKYVALPESNSGKSSAPIGVEFIQVNKDGVRRLIRSALRNRDRQGFYQRNKREFSFMLKSAPLLFFIAWFTLEMASSISVSIKKEEQYTQKRREAEIYYLFGEHGK